MSGTKESTTAETVTPLRWARGISERHAKALSLLTGEEVKVIKRGLAALDRIKAAEDEVAAMQMVHAKLTKLVEAAGAS